MNRKESYLPFILGIMISAAFLLLFLPLAHVLIVSAISFVFCVVVVEICSIIVARSHNK